ncbi:MAG TPA: DNA-directed RNA polymerase subunit omega [Candidatus Omnitrophota bacterium]|nr:DNA-directed RNA polymerase subunit omega [Candidatus Omnitrophota bacterium]HPT07178.1 DNA-directed RNA polymerase subunit omega [Candidatus Omnitrophota bacterium]
MILEYVPIEKLIDKSNGSIYKLVIMASRRGLEIAEGQPKLVAMDSSIKPSTIALHEIAEGKVFIAPGKKSK